MIVGDATSRYQKSFELEYTVWLICPSLMSIQSAIKLYCVRRVCFRSRRVC